MKRLPNIDITKEEYEHLLGNRVLTAGGEGVIITPENTSTAYKLFINGDTLEPKEMSNNKLAKIIHQYLFPLEHSVQPLASISVDGLIAGYEMTYDKDDVILCSSCGTRQRTLDYLRQVREALKYFESKGIIYGDLRGPNILVNPQSGKIKFCDMDNIQLQDMLIDLMDYNLICYTQEHGPVDEKVHAFFHNLLTVQKLNTPNLEYQQIQYKLADNPRVPGFRRPAQDVFASMFPQREFTGEYVIDYAKEKQPQLILSKTWKC